MMSVSFDFAVLALKFLLKFWLVHARPLTENIIVMVVKIYFHFFKQLTLTAL